MELVPSTAAAANVCFDDEDGDDAADDDDEFDDEFDDAAFSTRISLAAA